MAQVVRSISDKMAEVVTKNQTRRVGAGPWGGNSSESDQPAKWNAKVILPTSMGTSMGILSWNAIKKDSQPVADQLLFPDKTMACWVLCYQQLCSLT